MRGSNGSHGGFRLRQRGRQAAGAAPSSVIRAGSVPDTPTSREASVTSDKKTADQTFRTGYLIHDVSRLRRNVYDKAMKPRGLTRAQWVLLTNIARHGEDGEVQTKLAEYLDLGKGTVGTLIDRLEARGLVTRRADPSDRRVNRVVMTPAGKEIHTYMMDVGRDLEREIFRGVPAEKQRELADLLSRIKSNLIDMGALAGSSVGD